MPVSPVWQGFNPQCRQSISIHGTMAADLFFPHLHPSKENPMASFPSKAVRINQHGGPEELTLTDVTVGDPGPGEIP
jgi:hypothetical protein